MTSTPTLTLYFDGSCPLCAAEVRRLETWNTAGHLGFVDIALPGFDPSTLGVDLAALNRELHSQTRAGELLTGLDSLLAAYTLVGRGWVVWPLRIRLLRPPLAGLYRWFARHRYSISKRLGFRRPVCDGDTCGIGNPFMK